MGTAEVPTSAGFLCKGYVCLRKQTGYETGWYKHGQNQTRLYQASTENVTAHHYSAFTMVHTQDCWALLKYTSGGQSGEYTYMYFCQQTRCETGCHQVEMVQYQTRDVQYYMQALELSSLQFYYDMRNKINDIHACVY